MASVILAVDRPWSARASLARAVAAVAAGNADDAVGAQQPARLGIGHVVLADMHPVASEFGGEVGAVVHDEGDAARLRDRLQDPGRAPHRVVVHILQAQLQAGDIAAGQRRRQFGREAVGVEGGRRDQVEPGRRPLVMVENARQSFPW